MYLNVSRPCVSVFTKCIYEYVWTSVCFCLREYVYERVCGCADVPRECVRIYVYVRQFL